MTDIDAVSQLQYDRGRNPIDWAADLIEIDLQIRDEVTAGLVAYGVPITLLDQSAQAYARRIVAKLLDAGWTPPQVGA
jgi:hypothetical protein